jgi:two-component system chemotaxis response regulator CheY
MKVLIIVDSVVMRNIHKNTLLEHGITETEMLEARDGNFALITAKSEDIDLFLVDWNMPGLNGIELIKKIRALDKYKNSPIIMVTSEAAKYNVMEAIEVGVTNYIVKPIKSDVLWEKISKYFEK